MSYNKGSNEQNLMKGSAQIMKYIITSTSSYGTSSSATTNHNVSLSF